MNIAHQAAKGVEDLHLCLYFSVRMHTVNRVSSPVIVKGGEGVEEGVADGGRKGRK